MQTLLPSKGARCEGVGRSTSADIDPVVEVFSSLAALVPMEGAVTWSPTPDHLQKSSTIGDVGGTSAPNVGEEDDGLTLVRMLEACRAESGIDGRVRGQMGRKRKVVRTRLTIGIQWRKGRRVISEPVIDGLSNSVGDNIEMQQEGKEEKEDNKMNEEVESKAERGEKEDIEKEVEQKEDEVEEKEEKEAMEEEMDKENEAKKAVMEGENESKEAVMEGEKESKDEENEAKEEEKEEEKDEEKDEGKEKVLEDK